MIKGARLQSQLVIEPSPIPSYITGLLKINTGAILHNYKNLQVCLPSTACAAVLKADAYGFGIKVIAPLLMQSGCQHFFVAHLEEALFLRSLLKTPSIYVLSGLLPGTSESFAENHLTPVINDFGMLKIWVKEALKRSERLPCILHFDTGMHRNGFDSQDTEKLLNELNLLECLDLHFVMSHLVSSHDPLDPLNARQRERFETIRKYFPQYKASLADTGGIYLDSSFHYHLARPGKGLFGLFSPPKGFPLLQPCVSLLGRVLQLRTAHKGESVGYGATYILTRESKLATLGIGFADGYDRRFGNQAYVEFEGFKAPVLGRISMDYTVVDVTDIPESLCVVGGWAELVNQNLTLDAHAHAIGTISRELSTGFGQRLMRIYE